MYTAIITNNMGKRNYNKGNLNFSVITYQKMAIKKLELQKLGSSAGKVWEGCNFLISDN